MLSTIRTSVKTKLESISSFAFVYDYHKVGVDWYPCATFEPSRVENEEWDTANNKGSYIFDIVIQQEISSLTKRGVGMDILVACVDEVKTAFDRDPTLSWICSRVIIRDINFWEVVHDKWDILYVSISLVCEALSFTL